jgi:hypothetical protein
VSGEAPAAAEVPVEVAEQIAKRTVQQWRVLVMFVLTLIVFTGSGFYYANWKAERTARDNNRRWCSLLTTMDDAYQSAPPSTATGKRLAEEIHSLHEGFNCRVTHP